MEAGYSAGGAKRTALKRANLRLEVTRHLWRLCHESQLVSARRSSPTDGAASSNLNSPRTTTVGEGALGHLYTT